MSKKLYDENGNVVKGAKVKKPFYKRWWFITLVAIFIIGAIGGGDDEESLKTTEAETEEVVEETEPEEIEQEPEETEQEPEEIEEVVEEEPEPEEEAVEITPEEERRLRTSLAVSLMERSFENTATIRYNEESDSITILPTDEDFAMAIMFLISGDIPMSEWYTLRDSFVEMSLSINENVGEGITISLLNPSNPDLTILTVVDGIVFYDAFDGI